MAIRNFIKTATLQNPRAMTHHQSCSSSCSANNSYTEMAMGTLNKWCDKFMQKSDGTLWNYAASQPRRVSPDLFSLLVWRILLREYHDITFDGWWFCSWYPSCLVPLTFSWSSLHIKNKHFSKLYMNTKQILCTMAWTTSNIHSFSWTCNPKPSPTKKNTCSCSCSISAKRDCSWQCQVLAGCPFWNKRMECWCPTKITIHGNTGTWSW